MTPSEEKSNPWRLWLAQCAAASCRGLSMGMLGLYGALYFVMLSFGAIVWMGLAWSPLLVDGARHAQHAVMGSSWGLMLGSTAAWLFFAWMGWRISLLAKGNRRRIRPGGSWLAWALMQWLVMLDASLKVSREPPGCMAAGGWVASNGSGLGRLAANMVRGWMALPARSMAICWVLVMVALMPLVVHLAMVIWMPAAIISILMPKGPGIGLMERVRLVALDLAKEGTQDWALAEREEIIETIDKAKREREERMRRKGKPGSKAKQRADESDDDGEKPKGPRRL